MGWLRRSQKKKRHQTNKRTIQTTFIYLRQSLFPKQVTFCRISREMTFPFPSPALQGQQRGGGETEINEEKGVHRLLLVPGHFPSFTEQVEGVAVLRSICHMSEIVHRPWSVENITHSTCSDLNNKFVLGQENKEKPRIFPIWPEGPWSSQNASVLWVWPFWCRSGVPNPATEGEPDTLTPVPVPRLVSSLYIALPCSFHLSFIHPSVTASNFSQGYFCKGCSFFWTPTSYCTGDRPFHPGLRSNKTQPMAWM